MATLTYAHPACPTCSAPDNSGANEPWSYTDSFFAFVAIIGSSKIKAPRELGHVLKNMFAENFS